MKAIYQTQAKAAYAGKTTIWKNTVIPRNYAYMPKIRQIALEQQSSNITTISIRGREDTGKTELAKGIAHTLHDELSQMHYPKDCDAYTKKHIDQIKVGYLVRLLTVEDLSHFREIVESLPKQNRILIFDDLSFTNLKKIKHDVTTVRHLQSGDVKTILIYNFHYSKGLDPYLRDTNYIFQTSATSGELQNLVGVYESAEHGTQAIQAYLKIYQKFKHSGKISINLNKKRQAPAIVNLTYSRPFRLALFSDGSRVAPMVFPTASRLGVDKCAICNITDQTAQADPKAIVEWIAARHRPKTMDMAMKNLCIQKYGYDIRHNGNSTPVEMLQRLERNGVIDLEEIITYYYKMNIDEVRTRIPKNLSIAMRFQDSFLDHFKTDGLRPIGVKPRTREQVIAKMNKKQGKKVIVEDGDLQ